MDPMTKFPVPDVEELPEDLRERIEEEEEDAGFIPNVFLGYAYKPSHFRGFFGYYDAIVENAEITREEIEMIIVTVSGVNECYYCTVAHGALLRIYGGDPLLADQLVANHRNADISEKHEKMLDFAVKLTEEPGRVTDEDRKELEEVGYSEEEIWDIASVTSFFNLSNRMSNVADMRPNEEFHNIARGPREEDE